MAGEDGAAPLLVGDIGATNARFGLCRPGPPPNQVLHTRIFPDEDFAGFEDALAAFLNERGGLPMPRWAALAVASAVTGDRVSFVNHPWSFSIEGLKARFGFERLFVINDFTAVARALPYLAAADRRGVGGGAPVPDMPIGVLGPGSGLGVSGMVPAADGWRALAGEGGHATMAAVGDRESAVLDRLRRHFDHVSAERVLSGPGLVNLYHALAALDGVPARGYGAAQITDPATGAADPLVAETVQLFCAMLGGFAGNLALTLGARGGVYIAGGIVPRLGDRIVDSPFRERFESKGRLRSYLAAIPTWVVTHPLPAFIGCASLLAA